MEKRNRFKKVPLPCPKKRIENSFAIARTWQNYYNQVYRLQLSLIHCNYKNLTKSGYNNLMKINFYPNQALRKV